MVLWYNMLDIPTLKTYTIFTKQHPDYIGGVNNACRLFIKKLGKELVMPQMKRHMVGMLKLQKHNIEEMGGCGLKKQISHKNTSDRRAKGRGKGVRSVQFPKTEKFSAGVSSAPGLCARSTNTD